MIISGRKQDFSPGYPPRIANHACAQHVIVEAVCEILAIVYLFRPFLNQGIEIQVGNGIGVQKHPLNHTELLCIILSEYRNLSLQVLYLLYKLYFRSSYLCDKGRRCATKLSFFVLIRRVDTHISAEGLPSCFYAKLKFNLSHQSIPRQLTYPFSQHYLYLTLLLS